MADQDVVKRVVNDQLKKVEQALRNKRGEIAELDNQMSRLSAHTVDLANQIDDHKKGIDTLEMDLHVHREKITALSDARHALDGLCQELGDQISGFREYLGGQG